MASYRVKDNSIINYLKLPRFKLKHPQLIIGQDTKYLDLDKFSEQDFMNCQKEFNQEISPKNKTCHKAFHSLRCKFVFEFYLDFLDARI